MMLRARFCAVAAALLLCVGLGMAQDTADIVVGGQVVARVREAGPYESVEARAAAIDDAINQVLEGCSDPATLEVTLEQVDGKWTVLIAGKPIVAVYPAEAEANGMAPEVLGAIWVRRFKDALPGARTAPVVEIGGPTVPGPVATATIEEEPTAPTTPATAPATAAPTTPPAATHTISPLEEPTTGAATNVGPPVVEVIELPLDESKPETLVSGQGARLLIIEAMNEARELSEDDYLVRREAMAEELFDAIVQVLTGGKAHGTLAAPGTPPEALTVPPAPPPTATTTTAPPPASTTVDTVTSTGAGAAPPTPAAPPAGGYELSADGRAKIEAAIPAGDPSYANVLSKVVVKAKFKAASEAYVRVRSEDPDTAQQARELLSAARRAMTAGEFDVCEEYLDAALGMLGVTAWEQHIDAAMEDLGLGG